MVRYQEIGLKGRNRRLFENHLEKNLRKALASFPGLRTRRIRGRILANAEVDAQQLKPAASKVFGIANLSPAAECDSTLAAIEAAAHSRVRFSLEGPHAGKTTVPFRVSVNRAQKDFPLTSMDLERQLGIGLQEQFPQLDLSLKAPCLKLEVDLRREGSWVFTERSLGPGGLPVGSLGRGLCLLSGGMDSPVAAWLAMKRGIGVDYVGFYAPPYMGPQFREKLIRLVERLNLWQYQSNLFFVPFTAIQERIRDLAPERFWILLYRRAMQAIATKLAFKRRYRALITGESVGQVASQTLEAMHVIEAAGKGPVLRPLVSFDKQETIALADKIGTTPISLLPAQDSCQLFAPRAPALYPTLEEVEMAEQDLDLATLIRAALRNTERLRIPETS